MIISHRTCYESEKSLMPIDILCTFFFCLVFLKHICLQKDNIRNQRENVIMIIANAQSRLGIPTESDPVSDIYVLTLNLIMSLPLLS